LATRTRNAAGSTSDAFSRSPAVQGCSFCWSGIRALGRAAATAGGAEGIELHLFSPLSRFQDSSLHDSAAYRVHQPWRHRCAPDPAGAEGPGTQGYGPGEPCQAEGLATTVRTVRQARAAHPTPPTGSQIVSGSNGNSGRRRWRKLSAVRSAVVTPGVLTRSR